MAHQSLKLVHLVFRHGERTPASTYPNDPYINDTFSPYGWGQLTNEGKMHQYKLGQWLRKRYGHFLGDQFNSDQVFAMSTDVDRTKASCQYMFAGLFPPKGPQIWNKNLLWQAVPLNYQHLKQDRLLLVRGCPKYSESLEEALKNKTIQDKIKSYEQLYTYLTNHTGVTVKTPWDVEDIYSTLKAEEGLNYKLPEWTKSVYPDKMKEVTAYSFELNVCSKELKKIKGGPLLKKILDDSKAKVEGKTKMKMYNYAGHDSTVANLMQAMNVWNGEVPGFNCLIMIELHDLKTYHGLKVFLKKSINEEPRELVIPGCESPCPLDKAYQTFAPMLPNNLDTLCKPKNQKFVPTKDAQP
ncbi:venom acid phosphatase Acph-1-like isoform X2 [Cimex lectularius]|uniref:acid phosphatase n=1 Tax=Cimex lectularius TaxID=79782 RepID=A0A8I6R5Q0_CIMLE|nr:venom acid phosphatase Acph-1-like isoform X2 [Cimex lectularius]